MCVPKVTLDLLVLILEISYWHPYFTTQKGYLTFADFILRITFELASANKTKYCSINCPEKGIDTRHARFNRCNIDSTLCSFLSGSLDHRIVGNNPYASLDAIIGFLLFSVIHFYAMPQKAMKRENGVK